MPVFGKLSKAHLSTCDERLQKVAKTAIKFFDFSVLDGHRDKETQDRLFKQGFSKLQWPKGKHNKLPSQAFDIAPHPVDFSNNPKAIARFYLLAGVILGVAFMMGIKLRWGGDWDGDWDLYDQNFDDLGHFELVD
jgi:hypothetical protein